MGLSAGFGPGVKLGGVEGGGQVGQLAVAFHPAELRLRALQTRAAPAPAHVPLAPAFHPGRDGPRHAQGRLDDVGARQRAAQQLGHAQPHHRERLLQPSSKLAAASGLILCSQRTVASTARALV